MLKHLVPKFVLTCFVRLKDIAEKQVPAKLKPIVVKTEKITPECFERTEASIWCGIFWLYFGLESQILFPTLELFCSSHQ